MGVGEVLDAGINLARRNFRLLALTATWGTVPANAFGALSMLLADEAPLASRTASLIRSTASVVTIMALIIACARLVEQTDNPAELEPGPLYRAALRRLGDLLLNGIVIAIVLMPLLVLFALAIYLYVRGSISAVVLAIPFLVLFPPSIYLYVRWSISLEALVIEGIGPAALGRSWGLTRRAWWHTFAIILASWLIIFPPKFSARVRWGGSCFRSTHG